MNEKEIGKLLTEKFFLKIGGKWLHVVTATELTGVEYYLNKLANLLEGLALECEL